ncbi:MAG: hypothetical protein IJ215_00155 [Clostridia bacterium]|nr:hypothetical protein [Clostridia bacterium]
MVDARIHTLDEQDMYLPLWLFKISLEGKEYTFLMNDTTSKCIADYKKDFKINDTILFLIGYMSIFLQLYPLVFAILNYIRGQNATAIVMAIISCILLLLGCTAFMNVFSRKKSKKDVVQSTVPNKPEIIEKNVEYEKHIKGKEVPDESISYYVDGYKV